MSSSTKVEQKNEYAPTAHTESPAHQPLPALLAPGQKADWEPSTEETETCVRAAQHAQVILRKAQANLTYFMAQATVCVYQAIVEGEKIRRSPAELGYKKRKPEEPLTVDWPDAETRKYIYRRVDHDDDYGWGKRARMDDQLSAKVSQLSVTAQGETTEEKGERAE
ncbi:hypothetical protein BGX21_006353 [Mortierella sp. AD011]|nr:hypothetical protein BGX20_006360 [Mortierella sp. AD010]KAF9368765.1 hypothetical protein BGX21_006353 [Mortierella sp. AD011]